MPSVPGLIDVPAPVFAWIDGVLGQVLPPLGRLTFWAVAAAAVSMTLYRFLSPQKRVARLKDEAAAARAELARYEGELRGMWPHAGRALALAGEQLRLALGPALVASLPVLALMVWLSTPYGHGLPPAGTIVAIAALRGDATAIERAVTWPGAGERLALRDPSGRQLLTLPLPEPVPLIHQRQWWNSLVANPAGYLADDATVDRVVVDLPRRSYLWFGPAWLRGWEAIFLSGLVLASLAIQLAFRIK
jgi:hypothetical protein